MKVILTTASVICSLIVCCNPIYKAPPPIPENNYQFNNSFELTFRDLDVENVKGKVINSLSESGFGIQQVYFADVLIETNYLELGDNFKKTVTDNKKVSRKKYRIALRVEAKENKSQGVDVNFSISPLIAGHSDNQYYTNFSQKEWEIIEKFLISLKAKILANIEEGLENE